MKLVGNKIKVYIFKNKKYHKYLTKLGLENAKKDENGKPYVPGIHFSISTANKYSCIAISKRYRVGIDILEKNQKIYHYEKVLKKWGIKKLSMKKFIRLWTIKEATIKIWSNESIKNINKVVVKKNFCLYKNQKICFKKIQNKKCFCTLAYIE